jgi:hypothetical protein
MFRYLISSGSLVAVVFILVSMGGSAGPAFGQTAKAAPKTAWFQTHTPDEQPDLQGVWTNATITPFERPAALAGKAVLTEDEAARIEAEAARKAAGGPPRPGDVGSYEPVWFDSGTKVVSTRQTSLVVDPPDGKVPLTALAEARQSYNLAHGSDSWEYLTLWDRCITRGAPGWMIPAGYNNAYQIVQTPGYVMILSEMIHEAHIIPLDTPGHPRPHVPPGVRLLNGDPVGHWEGNTLVVDTTNFNGKGQIATSMATGRIRGMAQSEDLHIVERFTRVDADTISYSATVTDPVMYTKPWKIAVPLSREDSYKIYEYACQEGNEAVGLVLKGGRAQDTASTEAAAAPEGHDGGPQIGK